MELPMNIVIINTHYRHEDLDGKVFYVGRPKRGGPYSPLANWYSHLDLPHTIKVDSVEDAVASFKNDLVTKVHDKDESVCNELNRIYGAALRETVFLSCWCMDELKPSRRDHACHAEVIRELILSKYKQRL